MALLHCNLDKFRVINICRQRVVCLADKGRRFMQSSLRLASIRFRYFFLPPAPPADDISCEVPCCIHDQNLPGGPVFFFGPFFPRCLSLEVVC